MSRSHSTGDDWLALKTWFQRLVEVPAADRGGLLQQAPTSLHPELLELLAQHDAEESGAGQFLNLGPPLELDTHAADRRGQRLGPWSLLTRLGRGGMGEVWEARRADGAYDARAAVKVLRQGFDSERFLHRFALEQRLLARLDHPHIARLLDAGRTDDDRPYFVMEYVAGRPIDQACHGLALGQRLELFLQLADAVAYAHRHLLLHRDLKPGNVLVTDEGQVKLLDFGIAKALDPLESEDAELTLAGERPFTPAFASPEQVRGEPLGTATDVYSLGVLLYRLLTGRSPYGGVASTAAEAARQVLTVPPLLTSSLIDAAPQSDPPDPQWPAIRRALRGDLENILQMALAKPIADRYPGADALAADLRAWLEGGPVRARTPSPAYLMSRFVRRNRVGVGVAVLVLLAMVGALFTLSWQQQQTDQARRDAEQRFADVRQLANGLVFRYHDKIVNLPGSLPVREALLADAARYLDSMASDLRDDPKLALELADTYQRIAVLQGEVFSPGQERIVEAEANLDKALALLPVAMGGGRRGLPPELALLHSAADMWMGKSILATRRGRLAQGVQALQSSRAFVQQALELAPRDLQVMSRQATLDGRLALLLGASSSMPTLGRMDEARGYLDQSLALFQQIQRSEPDNPEWTHQLAWAYSNLVSWAVMNGQHDEAFRHAERTVALRDAASAARPDNAHYRHQKATARSGMATAMAYRGQAEQALALHDSVEASVRATIAADPGNRSAERDLLLSQITRGRSLHLAGRQAAARTLLQDTLAALARVPGADDDFYLNRWRAEGQLWLARALGAGKDFTAALAAAEAALVLVDLPEGADPENATRRWSRALALGEQAQALDQLGQSAAARQRATSANTLWQAGVPGLLVSWAARDRALVRAEAPVARHDGHR